MTTLQHPAPAGGMGDIDGRAAWLRMVVCLALATIGGAGMWSMVVVLPAVQAEFAVERAAASLPYTAMMVGFAAGNVFFGRAIDRFGAALPLAAAAVMLSSGFAVASLSASLWQFLLVQGLLIGLGSSASFGPLLADISHWFVRRRGIAVTGVACGNYVAGALWPLAMQPMLEAGGWRFAYLMIGLICLVTMLPLCLMLRRRLPEAANDAGAGVPGAGLLSAGMSPATLQGLLIVAGIGCCVAMSMPQVHIVAYCVDLGFGVARGAEMLSLMVGAGIVSRLVSGVFADRIGGARTLLIGSAGQMLALFLYLPFDGLVSLYVVSLVFGLAQGGIVPMYAIMVREYMPAREAGARVGTVIMATIAGMALGGWLSGAIYDMTGSYQAAFLNGIAWNALNLAVICFILWRSRPRNLTRTMA
ncbi:MAG: MFS transporter [Rhizobiaceae bacterium]